MKHSIIHTGHCHSCEQGQGEMQKQRLAALLCQCQICARAAWHTRKHLVRRLKSFLTRTKTPDASNAAISQRATLQTTPSSCGVSWHETQHHPHWPLSQLRARPRGNAKTTPRRTPVPVPDLRQGCLAHAQTLGPQTEELPNTDKNT